MGTVPSELVKMGDQVALDYERSVSKKRAEELKSNVLKGQLSSYGIDPVRDALTHGRVNTLVMLSDYVVPGWICENASTSRRGLGPRSAPSAAAGPLR
jgi:hypothetical protein